MKTGLELLGTLLRKEFARTKFENWFVQSHFKLLSLNLSLILNG